MQTDEKSLTTNARTAMDLLLRAGRVSTRDEGSKKEDAVLNLIELGADRVMENPAFLEGIEKAKWPIDG